MYKNWMARWSLEPSKASSKLIIVADRVDGTFCSLSRSSWSWMLSKTSAPLWVYSISLHSAEGTLEPSFSLDDESSLLPSRLSTVDSSLSDSSSSDLNDSRGPDDLV